MVRKDVPALSGGPRKVSIRGLASAIRMSWPTHEKIVKKKRDLTMVPGGGSRFSEFAKGAVLGTGAGIGPILKFGG